MTQNKTDTDEIENIDPNAYRCPWCNGTRIWKGRHAATQHPEKWDAFKEHFDRKTGAKVVWVRPDEYTPD